MVGWLHRLIPGTDEGQPSMALLLQACEHLGGDARGLAQRLRIEAGHAGIELAHAAEREKVVD